MKELMDRFESGKRFQQQKRIQECIQVMTATVDDVSELLGKNHHITIEYQLILATVLECDAKQEHRSAALIQDGLIRMWKHMHHQSLEDLYCKSNRFLVLNNAARLAFHMVREGEYVAALPILLDVQPLLHQLADRGDWQTQWNVDICLLVCLDSLGLYAEHELAMRLAQSLLELPVDDANGCLDSMCECMSRMAKHSGCAECHALVLEVIVPRLFRPVDPQSLQ